MSVVLNGLIKGSRATLRLLLGELTTSRQDDEPGGGTAAELHELATSVEERQANGDA